MGLGRVYCGKLLFLGTDCRSLRGRGSGRGGIRFLYYQASSRGGCSGRCLVIKKSFGFNCGYAINPARDFSPRLFTAVAGWGSEVFTAGNYFFWVPIVGPCVGAVLGGAAYDFFITRHHPGEDDAGDDVG